MVCVTIKIFVHGVGTIVHSTCLLQWKTSKLPNHATFLFLSALFDRDFIFLSKSRIVSSLFLSFPPASKFIEPISRLLNKLLNNWVKSNKETNSKMHSFGFRANALLTFAATILAVICAMASFSDTLNSPSPTAQVQVSLLVSSLSGFFPLPF